VPNHRIVIASKHPDLRKVHGLPGSVDTGIAGIGPPSPPGTGRRVKMAVHHELPTVADGGVHGVDRIKPRA
jgi:hypothetical protein